MNSNAWVVIVQGDLAPPKYRALNLVTGAEGPLRDSYKEAASHFERTPLIAPPALYVALFPKDERAPSRAGFIGRRYINAWTTTQNYRTVERRHFDNVGRRVKDYGRDARNKRPGVAQRISLADDIEFGYRLAAGTLHGAKFFEARSHTGIYANALGMAVLASGGKTPLDIVRMTDHERTAFAHAALRRYPHSQYAFVVSYMHDGFPIAWIVAALRNNFGG